MCDIAVILVQNCLLESMRVTALSTFLLDKLSLMCSVQDENTADDVLLEAIKVCGSLSVNYKCAESFLQVGVLQSLVEILKGM